MIDLEAVVDIGDHIDEDARPGDCVICGDCLETKNAIGCVIGNGLYKGLLPTKCVMLAHLTCLNYLREERGF